MGWWESYDGTVIGDELADVVGSWMDNLVICLVEKYPTISRDQVLHTIAFCSGGLPHFEKGRRTLDSDKALAVMSITQKRRWNSRHKIPPDLSKRIASGTSLENVFNPFTGERF